MVNDNERVDPASWASFNWGRGNTTIEKLVVVLSGGLPLSVTRTVTLLVPGTGAPAVAQLKNPVVGLMTAPGGAPASSANDRVCGGLSASVAEAVRFTVCPVWTNRLAIAPGTGAVFGMTLFVPGVAVGMK